MPTDRKVSGHFMVRGQDLEVTALEEAVDVVGRAAAPQDVGDEIHVVAGAAGFGYSSLYHPCASGLQSHVWLQAAWCGSFLAS